MKGNNIKMAKKISFLINNIRGSLSLLFFVINTILWCGLIFIMSILKILIPIHSWRKFSNIILNSLANNWILVNNYNIKILNNIEWDVQGIENLSRKKWYMVISNHQSWVDILVLQKIFYRKIPFLKFFLKKELIWVPFLGIAWWALDFPFMRRYTKAFLKKYPHLKNKDIEITRKSCEKFKTIPVSIMNFVEGTRFTRTKYLKQQPPYSNLLKPKSGGIAFVLAAMNGQLQNILNVTIIYQGGVKSFWEFLCGRVKKIKVTVDTIPISEELHGDYFNDMGFKLDFQGWVNTLWDEKDKLINNITQ